MTLKDTPNGWKQTNSLSGDENADIVNSAFFFNKITEV